MSDLLEKYFFALNHNSDYKVSKCPFCQNATFKRKFPLVIHINKAAGLLNLGFTCKYSAKCEFIVADPSCIGNEYMVLGTSDKSLWKKKIKNSNLQTSKAFKIIRFKGMYNLANDY